MMYAGHDAFTRDLQRLAAATGDAMQAEHVRIDPRLDDVEQALAASDAGALAESLTGHMRHEDNARLPPVEALLGSEGWDAFRRAIRKTEACGQKLRTCCGRSTAQPVAIQVKVLAQLPPRSGSYTGWCGRRGTGVSLGRTAMPAFDRNPPAAWRI
jgi:hypothetical protein